MPSIQILPVFDTPDIGLASEGCWIWMSVPSETEILALTDSEQARVDALLDARKKVQLARHLVERRAVLSRLLSRAANDIVIDHDTHGRPFLASDPGWSLSLAGSGDWNALGLSRSHATGIDIEVTRAIDWKPMLSMTSAPDERPMIIDAIETAGTLEPFFRMWTVKEAALKAIGTGLRGGAPKVRVPEGLITGVQPDAVLTYEDVPIRVSSHVTRGVAVAWAQLI